MLADVPEHDLKAQASVLELILLEHPDGLGIDALQEALEGEISQAEEGAVLWALQDLVAVGLLQVDRASVLPTPAAIHFHRLQAI